MPRLAVSLNQEAYDLPSIPINFSASGVNLVIAGIAGQIIRVFRMIVVVGGSTSLTFQNGSSSLTGPIPLATNEAIVLTLDTAPWFLMSLGNPWQINSSNAVQVSGAAYYTQT